jgi:hypothetical protein
MIRIINITSGVCAKNFITFDAFFTEHFVTDIFSKCPTCTERLGHKNAPQLSPTY